MTIFVELVKFFIYTICIVVISKYALIRVLRKLGETLNLKPKIIGNIAGVATSIPEFLTVLFSSISGLIGASFYNIMSSNIINFVLYYTSIILNKNQAVLKNKAIKIDIGLVIITIILPIILAILKVENNSLLIPLFLILFFLFYRITNNAHKLYMNKPEEQIDENQDKKKVGVVIWQWVLLIFIGFILFIIGNLLSNVLQQLCINFKIPEIFIGILLGLITSLPEMITFFESQKHHENEKEGVIEATSNLLTSNIMNLFVIQTMGMIIYLIATK